MNAQILLVALAAICCVQGITAAAVARPVPSWTEVDVADFADMDFEEVLETVMMMVDQLEEETGMELNLHLHALKQDRAVKNIFTCGTSILNLVKTLKQVYGLVREFQIEKSAYKAAQAACDAAPTPAPVTPGPVTPEPATPAPAPATPAPATAEKEECLEQAKSAYAAAKEASKAKIPGVALKTVTSVVSLKSCFLP